ncbi:MAG: hypothetical protein RTU30_05105 [Candidatus Thorarchaeota archaeon]
MKDIALDDQVWIVRGTSHLFSGDKVIVEVQTGCVWVRLLQDEVPVGLAFVGPSRFVVDAIAETEMGAIGESVTRTLQGVQVYLGKTELEMISDRTSAGALKELGFDDEASLLDAVNERISDMRSNNRKIDIDDKSGDILLGMDLDKKDVIIVSKGKELIFVHDKQVAVLGGDNLVRVGKEGIAVGGKDGRTMTISRDGIRGLDAVVDIEPIIRGAMSSAMTGLRGLKGLKKLKRAKHVSGHYGHRHYYGPGYRYGAYESVDDFDWDD